MLVAMTAILLATTATLPAAAAAQAQASAPATDGESLAGLINAYRAAPGACPGMPSGPPPAALAPHPALARVQVGAGTFLDVALERLGYPVARAEAVYVSIPHVPASPMPGSQHLRTVMEALTRRYCRTLLSTQFSAIGVSRAGDTWQIVFAQPAPAPLATRLPDPGQAGLAVLAAVNTARAAGRSCGDRYYPAAPALAWNGALADAALAHSADMARQRYFSHTGKDGRVVGERALQAGYRWRRIAENIAAGQESAEEAVAGWLSSPGHCANIMHAGMTDMGAAYGVSSGREAAQLPRVYWTQVFGTPR